MSEASWARSKATEGHPPECTATRGGQYWHEKGEQRSLAPSGRTFAQQGTVHRLGAQGCVLKVRKSKPRAPRSLHCARPKSTASVPKLCPLLAPKLSTPNTRTACSHMLHHPRQGMQATTQRTGAYCCKGPLPATLPALGTGTTLRSGGGNIAQGRLENLPARRLRGQKNKVQYQVPNQVPRRTQHCKEHC